MSNGLNASRRYSTDSWMGRFRADERGLGKTKEAGREAEWWRMILQQSYTVLALNFRETALSATYRIEGADPSIL